MYTLEANQLKIIAHFDLVLHSIRTKLKNQITYLCFSLVSVIQITRRDEEMAPFIAGSRRNYIFGGICSVASNGSIKVCIKRFC